MVRLRQVEGTFMKRAKVGSVAVAVALLLASASGWAADLTIGRATEQAALDPQFSDLGNDDATAQNMFDSLVMVDSKLQSHPGLALSWTLLDPLTWEVKLRPNVKFNDGAAFTGEDVAFSLQRARNVPNSPGPLGAYLSAVKSVEVIDPLTIHIHTVGPTPLLQEQVGRIFIIPAHLGTSVTTADFNSGKAMIGTGPYRFVSAAPGDNVVMAPNPYYWGPKPQFDKVTLKFIANAASRSAALLSNQVDVIEQVPSADVQTLASHPGIKTFSTVTSRIVYVGIDSDRTVSPLVTDKDGKPMDTNPLKDKRVREAMSLMINRVAIVQRILNGAGEPAGQLVPEGMGGYAADLPAPPYDPKAAKALLTEAGYPQGFGLTLDGSSDRFPADSLVAQAVGQMFSHGGIRINGIDVSPYSVYTAQATARKYSVFIFSFGSIGGSSANGLLGVLATYNKQAGTGSLNRARYSNPAFDAVLKQALSEFDEQKRNALLAQATRIAMQDDAILPLYWQKLFWAARGNYVIDPDRGEATSTRFVSVGQ
jgi:peptide/nickel transport system substrate-binding protein